MPTATATVRASIAGPGTILGEFRALVRNLLDEGSVSNLVGKVSLGRIAVSAGAYGFRQVFAFRTESNRLVAELERGDRIANDAARITHANILVPPMWSKDP